MMTIKVITIIMMMMTDVIDQAAKAPASISIMERSLFSERYCFVQVGDHYSQLFCSLFSLILLLEQI